LGHIGPRAEDEDLKRLHWDSSMKWTSSGARRRRAPHQGMNARLKSQ
jgi:hypothetical protein